MSNLTTNENDDSSSDNDESIVVNESPSTIPKVHYHREHEHWTTFADVCIRVVIDLFDATHGNSMLHEVCCQCRHVH